MLKVQERIAPKQQHPHHQHAHNTRGGADEDLLTMVHELSQVRCVFSHPCIHWPSFKTFTRHVVLVVVCRETSSAVVCWLTRWLRRRRACSRFSSTRRAFRASSANTTARDPSKRRSGLSNAPCCAASLPANNVLLRHVNGGGGIVSRLVWPIELHDVCDWQLLCSFYILRSIVRQLL